MNRELARKVADAVLYEGYMLYPYRPSAIKNRQRWSFGILYPPEYHEVRGGTERARMHSECLVETAGGATVQIQLRFLHLATRQIAQFVEGRFEAVPSLAIDDRVIESWDEPIERSVEFELPLLAGSRQLFHFSFPASDDTERLHDQLGRDVGRVTRTQCELTGTLSVSTQEIREGVLKLILDVTNTSSFALDPADRNAALLRSLLSAHTIITLQGGEFVSLLDPRDDLREAVSSCKNVGNFPVLVGSQHEHDMLLCSPVVLYDYPQIAPESAGDFYDATEMDEMLTLRVLTLTDEEKNRMRFADGHVRDLLQRTEQNAREQLTRTHGTIRSLRPISEGHDGLE